MTRWTEHHPDHKVQSAGAWPFTTFRCYHHRGRLVVWRARHHRKGLNRAARALPETDAVFWQTQGYNWYTGFFFAVGSLLFMLGSVLALAPNPQGALPAWLVNSVFFAGSIPFTIAGYLQHFQAANTDAFDFDPAAPGTRRIALLGWHPDSPGWLSTFCQFVGTVAFNYNTFDAIRPPSAAAMQNLVIWLPGMIGSVLFLVSGYLAFIETAHAYWRWRPRDLDWWIVLINLLGCVAFMIASIMFWIPKGREPEWILDLANSSLGLGAFGFLIGAVLMMQESRAADFARPA